MHKLNSGLSPKVDLSLVLAFRLRPNFDVKSGLRPNRQNEVKFGFNFQLKSKPLFLAPRLTGS